MSAALSKCMIFNMPIETCLCATHYINQSKSNGTKETLLGKGADADDSISLNVCGYICAITLVPFLFSSQPLSFRSYFYCIKMDENRNETRVGAKKTQIQYSLAKVSMNNAFKEEVFGSGKAAIEKMQFKYLI